MDERLFERAKEILTGTVTPDSLDDLEELIERSPDAETKDLIGAMLETAMAQLTPAQIANWKRSHG